MRGNLFSCWYAAPQVPKDARRLFEAACANSEFGEEIGSSPLDPRGAAVVLALSREWGIPELEARVAAAIEEQLEPTWDAERGEFTWGLGLEEEHPRGQYNAFLAAAEAMSPGAWTGLSAAPLEPCPQVVDVEFPNVALSRARWSDGALDLQLSVLDPDPGRETHFRIVGVDTRKAWVLTEGAGSLEAGERELRVRAPKKAGALQLRPAAA